MMNKDINMPTDKVDLYICSIQPCTESDIACIHREKHSHVAGCESSCNTGEDKCIPVETQDVICSNNRECERTKPTELEPCLHSVKHKKMANEDCDRMCGPGPGYKCVPVFSPLGSLNKYLISKTTAKATRHYIRSR